MPIGDYPKRERDCKELESRFKKEGRYPGREDDVAARIVNMQRADYGETRGELEKDVQGKSPDRDLPLKDYQQLTVAQIYGQLEKLSKNQLRQVRAYETAHKKRKGVLDELNDRLKI